MKYGFKAKTTTTYTNVAITKWNGVVAIINIFNVRLRNGSMGNKIFHILWIQQTACSSA